MMLQQACRNLAFTTLTALTFLVLTVGAAKAAGAIHAAIFKRGVTEAIIGRAFLVVGKNFVSVAELFEL